MRFSRCTPTFLAFTLGACAVGPNYHAPTPDIPPSFVSTTEAPGEIALASWWHALNDEELNGLVERAVHSNLDLQIALDHVQAARTYEMVIVGHGLPDVDATGAAAKGTGTDLARGRAQQGLVSADNGSGLQHINTLVGFDAVWQLDLFGKYRREFEAARADADAAQAARNDVLTVIVADVVRAYIDLRGFQVRIGVLRQDQLLLQDSLRIVTIRYQRGITNELDVALATRELATVEAEIEPLQARESAAEYSLSVLVGEYPEALVNELSIPDLIPNMPRPASAGVPLDLLKRRADIQEAERRLAAASARIGVATADLFPQVTLVGAIGAQNQGLGTAPNIGTHVWSFGPAAAWPLLDFGALDAQIDIADITARSRLTEYRKTILQAVQEVDSALQDYAAQQSRLEKLGEALIAGQRAVDLAQARYDRGLTDFLNVVDAQRQYYDLQEHYAEAQVQLGEEFVALYKGLGGGWEHYQQIPSVRLPQPAIVAAFRRALTPTVHTSR